MTLTAVALLALSASAAASRSSTPLSFVSSPATLVYDDSLCAGKGSPTVNEDLVSRFPYITGVTEKSAVISWGTDTSLTAGSLAIYPAGSPSSRRTIPISSSNTISGIGMKTLRLFRAMASDLQADTVYCYELLDTTTSSTSPRSLASGFGFRTAPISDRPVRFLAVGDFGAGNSYEARVRDQIASRLDGADMFLALGDDTYLTGLHYEYQTKTFAYYKELWARLPLYLCPGNHDCYASNCKAYLENFYQFPEGQGVRSDHKDRYFSFDFGANIHFVSLDTEGCLDESATREDGMMQWLRRDLASTSKPWKLVMLHKPPYTQSKVADSRVVQKLNPIFEEFGVQVVFGGHWHDYQRFAPLIGDKVVPTTQGGVTYIIAGGGGYPISGAVSYVEDDNIGVQYQPWGSGSSATNSLEMESLADATFAASAPVVYKAVYSFIDVTVKNACDLEITAVKDDGSILDQHTVTRC